MPFRYIFFSFAKCENSIEVAGHENMTLTQRMAHVSCNDVDPMTVIFHLADLVSLTHLTLIFLTHLA